MKESMFYSQVIQASELAVFAHKSQYRRGTDIPYVVHPLRVARVISESKIPEGLKINRRAATLAAILHDVLEDSDTDPKIIKKLFGKTVSRIVEELTQDKTLPQKKRRKKMVKSCKEMSNEAKLVKLADREDNLRDMQPFGIRSNIIYCNETIRMLDSGLSGISPEIEGRIRRILSDTLSEKP